MHAVGNQLNGTFDIGRRKSIPCDSHSASLCHRAPRTILLYRRSIALSHNSIWLSANQNGNTSSLMSSSLHLSLSQHKNNNIAYIEKFSILSYGICSTSFHRCHRMVFPYFMLSDDGTYIFACCCFFLLFAYQHALRTDVLRSDMLCVCNRPLWTTFRNKLSDRVQAKNARSTF